MSEISESLPSGEVTFLFTDMEGSTAAWDAHGDAMDAVQVRHDHILRAAIHANRGYVFSTGGDGLASAFWTADEALLAATQAQAGFAAQTWSAGLEVRVRMGMHTGQAIERSGDYFGPTVIRAARLMGLVGGRRLVMSAATRAGLHVIPNGVQLVPVGTVRLKGLSVPEEVFGVVADGLEETGEPIGRRDRLKRQVPHAATGLFGRQRERQLVAQHLLEDRLVSVVGSGGVGKTRLVTSVIDDVADKFPDGIAFVELASVDRGDDVLQSVADLLGVVARGDTGLLDQLCTEISGQRMLVVLDNCEHVVSAVRGLVTELVARCRTVALLLTSREPLQLAGERVVRLDVLDVSGTASAAVEMLRDRIGGDLSDGDLDVLPVLASAVDGLPLALELVAARASSIGPGEVLKNLRDRGIAVAAWSVDQTVRTSRHSSIESLLDWSYGLLDPVERQVFEHVSMFAQGFSVDSAATLCRWAFGGDDHTVRSSLDRLITTSMLVRRGDRCQLLELTQHYARHKLDESGNAPAARRAHRRITTETVVAIHDGLRGEREDALARRARRMVARCSPVGARVAR